MMTAYFFDTKVLTSQYLYVTINKTEVMLYGFFLQTALETTY